MTDWKIVYSGYDNKPESIDTSSSPTTIYERKDFEEVTKELENGKIIKQWKYKERQYKKDEYNMIQSITNNIQFKHESDIIDEYTMELIEGGVI